jgi:predicted N-acetyltransferase YhbS
VQFEIDYLARHEGHLPLVASWQRAEFGYLNPTDTLEARTARLKKALQTDGLPLCFIAIADGRLVGAAGIMPSTVTHQHLSPWLSSVFVPAEHRGNGIASALALWAVGAARRLGHEKLYVFTPRNEALYARLGWRTIDRVTHRETPLTIMERPTNENADKVA